MYTFWNAKRTYGTIGNTSFINAFRRRHELLQAELDTVEEHTGYQYNYYLGNAISKLRKMGEHNLIERLNRTIDSYNMALERHNATVDEWQRFLSYVRSRNTAYRRFANQEDLWLTFQMNTNEHEPVAEDAIAALDNNFVRYASF